MKLKRPVKASLTLRRPEPAPGVERDPSASQTPEEITEYYRNAKVGDPACIRMTYNISLHFKMTVIEKAAHKSRIATRDGYPWGG